MSANSLDTYKVSLTPALWYRIAPPGGKSDPSQPSVQEMTVKSWINSPNAEGGVPKAAAESRHEANSWRGFGCLTGAEK